MPYLFFFKLNCVNVSIIILIYKGISHKYNNYWWLEIMYTKYNVFALKFAMINYYY